MNTKNKLGIHFVGLTPKEVALFERVISFNVTHGLVANIETDINIAELIITSADSFESIAQHGNDKTLLVITNEESNSQGDLQLCRPLMITKVMGALTQAIELNETKQNAIVTENTIDVVDESQQLADISIENVMVDDIATESELVAVIEQKVEPVNTASHHALIIDDSAAIRKQLELELRDAGISSDFAVCGEDALEKIKDNHFDLVFLDIIMPGLDGYETCKAMRTTIGYKKTPIIMLSGKTSPLDEVQGVIAGATTYLTKPVKSDKLQETLNRVTKWIDNYAPPKRPESV